MDGARWQKIQAVFHEATELPEAERDDFVRINCAADEQLASEVLAMLQHDSHGKGLLDRDLAETAQKTIAAWDPLAGKTFGPYKIVRLLGEHGRGLPRREN